MRNNKVPDPLGDLLESYCNVNAPSIDDLANDLKNSINPEVAKIFREQLAKAIIQRSLTLDKYEELTGEEFDTQDDLDKWLSELWMEIFGDVPIE